MHNTAADVLVVVPFHLGSSGFHDGFFKIFSLTDTLLIQVSATK